MKRSQSLSQWIDLRQVGWMVLASAFRADLREFESLARLHPQLLDRFVKV
jgi:hypothetical protein